MRVLAVSGPDPGHLLPVAAVAVALRRRGHRVTVSTTPRWHADLREAGVSVAPLPDLHPDERDADLGWRMWGRAAAMAPGLADLLAERSTRAVVADTLTGAGGFAAELCGLPWVEVVPHWLWAPSRSLPPVGLGMDPPRGPLARLHAAHLRRRQRRSFALGRRQRDHARRWVGLGPGGGPDLRLVATLPGLEVGRPDWPSRTHVVGALEWEPASWPTLTAPDGPGPVVLVADSTASDVEASVAEPAVEALAGGDVRLVITTRRPLPATAGTVVGRGRHGALLDRAACALTHGGHGLVAKALSRGVPVVVVPLQGDQRETAARVRRAGAGLTVPPGRLTPAALRGAVREVVGDPGYAASAGRIAREAAGLGADRAAQLVERRLPVG